MAGPDLELPSPQAGTLLSPPSYPPLSAPIPHPPWGAQVPSPASPEHAVPPQSHPHAWTRCSDSPDSLVHLRRWLVRAGPGPGRAGHPGSLKGLSRSPPCLGHHSSSPWQRRLSSSCLLRCRWAGREVWGGVCCAGLRGSLGRAVGLQGSICVLSSVVGSGSPAEAEQRGSRTGEGPSELSPRAWGADSQPWLLDPAQPSWGKSPSVGTRQAGSWRPRPTWSLRSVRQVGAGPGSPMDSHIAAQIWGPCAGLRGPGLLPTVGGGTMSVLAPSVQSGRVNHSENSSLGPPHPVTRLWGLETSSPASAQALRIRVKGPGSRARVPAPCPCAPPQLPGTTPRALTCRGHTQPSWSPGSRQALGPGRQGPLWRDS